ncbi:MAG TPA: pilus assembly protein N-terminal domain-containing protein [Terriglobales bacterium]|nr:pilus assembly protein N-terminal domain-containing protein [Terriglobales bacterium]
MKSFFTSAKTLRFVSGWLTLALIGFSSTIAAAQSTLTVDLDGARRLVLKAPAKDVVIGNPSIADVTLVSPTSLIIIGHTPGRTRLLVLDSDQVPLVDQIVIVTQGDSGLVSVFGPRASGAIAQDDYACGNHCTLMPSAHSTSGGGGGSGKVDDKLSGSDSAPPPATGQTAPGNSDQPAPDTKPSY